MSTGSGLTVDEIKKLKSIAGEKGGIKIDSYDCAKLRRRYRSGERAGELADEFDVSRKTLTFHLSNRCVHEVDAAGIKSANTDDYRRIHCWIGDCGHFEASYDRLTDHYHAYHGGHE